MSTPIAETENVGAVRVVVTHPRVSTARRLVVALLTGLLVVTGLTASAAAPAQAFGSSEALPVPSVNAGGYMTCGVQEVEGVTDGGAAVCWGDNVSEGPGQASPPTDVLFRTVNAGYAVGCGVTVDGALRCWGSDLFNKVSEVPAGEDFIHVAPGFNMICALRNDGSLPDGQGTPVCWGGDATDDSVVTAAPTTEVFTQLTMGIRHACGLRPDGTILCWGSNTYLQTDVPPGTYSAVNTGNFTVCAIRSTDDALDGTVVCWGRDQGGQVTTVPAGVFTQVSAGFAHVCGLRVDATITCWGRNTEGQTDAPAGTYTNVSAGTFHSCAMASDGPPAHCWGNNAAGRVQPSLSNAPPPPGDVAAPYSFQLVMETHVSPPPTYAVTAGALPPGVALSEEGLLSGTPTTAGIYTVTVAASTGLSPPDCVSTTTGSRPCTPGDPASNATATRVFSIVVDDVVVAEGVIAGQVTDAGSTAPIFGATVTVTDSGGAEVGQATTDAGGAYSFDPLAVGTYSVTADGAGYGAATQPAVDVADGATTVVDFALVAGTVECGDIITSDITLTADIGPCEDGGLVVAASGTEADPLVVDLGGFTIFGVAGTPDDEAGVLVDGQEYVVVRNGTIREFDGGVAVDGGQRNHLEDLVIENNIGSPATTWGEGVAFWDSDHNTVCNSVIANNGPYGGVGVYVTGTTGNVVGDPACGAATLAGANEAGVGGNLIVGNDTQFNADVNQNDGVRLEPFTDSTTVVNNVVEGSGLDGIAIFSRSTDNTVIGNIVRDNGAHDKLHRFGSGIIAFAGSARNVIEDNTVTANAANGIVLRGPAGAQPGSMDNVVRNNTALGNATGLAEDPGSPLFDLHDANFEPPCDNNVWSDNIFETFNQVCVTGATAPAAPAVEALAGWHAATFTITPGDDGGVPVTSYEVTLLDGDTVVDTATVAADGDLSVTFGDLETGTTYTASVVATNAAGDSEAGTATATPFVPADTSALTIAERACPAGSSITWTVVNSLDIPVSFDWIAQTGGTSGTDVVEAGASTEVTTSFAGPNRNTFRLVVDRILQDRTQSRLADYCP